MPRREPRFTPKEADDLLDFLKNQRKYTENSVAIADDTDHAKNYEKLRKYLHNIILRRAGLESNVSCFGSRIIGTSSFKSDLDLYVDVGKVITQKILIRSDEY